MKPRHKYIEDLIDTLQEVAPTAFPKKPLSKVPLSHRQHKVIQAILDVDWHTADTVLSWWCQGRRYDKACSVEGVPRYRVDGKVGGVVTAHDAQWHKDNLEEYYRRHAAKYHQVSLVDYYEAKFKPITLRDKLRKLWHQCIQKCSSECQKGVL